MEEDRRGGIALELGDDDVGEAPVDGEVALVPGVMEALVDVRRARETPEIVLREPQDRIRDDVVVPVVRPRVVGDETKPVRRSVARALLDRLTVRLAGDGSVLIAHRARDPGDVVVRDKAAKRGHESAAPSAGDTLAVGVA